MERLLDDTEKFASQLPPASSFAPHANTGVATMAGLERALAPGPRVSPVAVGDTQTSTSCELRAITTVAELVESYRLRYEVYRALGYLQRLNRSRLDIDAYDRSAIPFGAFDAGSGTMIGTLRLVTTERQLEYERLIEGVLAEVSDGELAEQALGPRQWPLPGIISDEVDRQIAAFNTEGFMIYELSRLIVRPGHRGSGVSRGLTQLGMAHAMRSGPAVIIGGCLPEHNQMYARYGFSRLPNTGLDRFKSVGQIANTIICRTDMMPQPTLSHLDELLSAMASGAPEHTLEIGRDSRALYRFAAPLTSASSRCPRASPSLASVAAP